MRHWILGYGMPCTVDWEWWVSLTKEEALDDLRLQQPERGVLTELRRTGLADAKPTSPHNLYRYTLEPCDCDTPWVHEESDVYAVGEWLELLNKGSRYEVVDTFHDFTVYDNQTGQAHGMGTGVGDVIVLPDCPYVFSLRKNQQWMAAAWTYVFNRDEELQEAYFG